LVAAVPHVLPGSLLSALVGAFANEIVTVACGLAVLAIASRSLNAGTPRQLLAHPVLVKLGEWSFAFYLVHGTVVYIALATLGVRPESWLNLLWFAALLVPSIVLAALLHGWVERPLEKRMRRWKDERDRRRTPAEPQAQGVS